ncbi:MAG: ABC transporter ATP-binding protein [Chthoniobacterales bacterium]
MNSLIRVFSYLRRYPLLALSTLFCAILGTSLIVVFPAVTQRIVDDVIGKKQPDLLLPLALAGLAAFFLQDFLNSLRIILNNHFEQRVIFDLRSDLYEHIQSLPLGWFDQRSTGDIMTRLVEDVTSMERVLIDGIEQGVVALLQIGVVASLMAFYDVRLMFAALAPIPFLFLGALLYTATARGRYRRQRVAASNLNSLLHDNIAGIRQIKTFVGEKREHKRFNGVSNKLRETTLVVMRAWAAYSPSMSFLASLGSLLVAVYGGWLVLEGNMDAGALVAFLVLTRFLYEPIGRLHQLNQLFQSGRAAADRVFEILDEVSEPGWQSGESQLQGATSSVSEGTERARGEVVFENICFAHHGASATLEGISLTANPGDTVALVGETGAGKSTLVNLLVRFYEYDSGQIRIDGRPVREISLRELRQTVGMVTQESFLFNGSTAENLLIGKPGATEAEMWDALEAANAADFIRRMPEGLHSQVGERGIRLSVGEKQRVAIARALLKNPPILILDEATASVDTQTERLIQDSLDKLMQSRTSFVIAHRLSTISAADQILVLDRGRIVQRGRHGKLIEEDGIYRELWKHIAFEDEEREQHKY